MKSKLILISSLFALASVPVQAQSLSINWHSIDGGGGRSTGGVYSVSGTVGQSDAGGPLSGGNFSVSGGFWSVFAIQSPNAPLLSVAKQGSNVRVFWPLPATGFVLDHSPTVTGTWSQVSFPYLTNATEISITVSPAITGSNRFYRLRKP